MQVDVQDVGLVEFPDDAKPDEISSVLNKRFPNPRTALNRDIAFQKQALASKAMGGDIEPTTDLLESVARTPALGINPQDPLSPMKAPLHVMGNALEQGAAAALNIPAAMYRSATGGTDNYPSPVTITKQDEQGRPVLTSEPAPLPFQPGQPVWKPRGTVLQPEGNKLQQIVSGFSTPGNIASFPFAEAKPVQAYFLSQTAPGAIDAAAKLVAPGTPLDQRRDVATDLLLDSIMSYGLAKGLVGRASPRAETQLPPETGGRPQAQPETAPTPEPAAGVSGRAQAPREQAPPEPAPTEIVGRQQAPGALNPRGLTPEQTEQFTTVGKDMGFSFDGVHEFPGIKPLLSFTFKNVPKDDPAYGATFNLRADATPEQILTKASDVAARFREEKTSTATAPAPAPAPKVEEPPGETPKGATRETPVAATDAPEQFSLFEAPKEKPADAQIIQLRRMLDTADRLYGSGERVTQIENKLAPLEQEKLRQRFGGTLPETKPPASAVATPAPEVTEPVKEKNNPPQPASPIPQTVGPQKTYDERNVPNDITTHRPTLRVQKQFLLAAIDKAMKEMKPFKLTPAQTKLMKEGNDISQSFERQSHKTPRVPSNFIGLSPHEQLNARANEWTRRMKNELPYITFDVPGDGVFHILQSATALSEFRKAVQKEFPAGALAKRGPSNARTSASPAPPRVENPDVPQIVKAIASHVATEDRPAISGIFSNGKEIVATDGRRMIRVLANGPGTHDVPVRIAPETGMAHPWNDKDWGRFPEYSAVEVPAKDLKFIGAADTETLWRDILRAELMTTEKANSIVLYRNPDGSFGTASHSPDVGESAHNVQKGATFAGAYNPAYLREALETARKLGNEKVDLYLKQTLSPLVIRGKNSQEIVMPMRLSDESGREQITKAKSEPVHAEPFPPAPETKWIKQKQALDLQNAKDDILALQKEIKAAGYAEGDSRLQKLRDKLAAAKEIVAAAKKRERAEAKKNVSESRIESRPGKQDPFTMDDGDLADLLEERYGEQGATGSPGQFGRPGEFTFSTYEAFSKWMDERYAERDHEGMRLAFAEADTPFKIRYVKENRAAGDHKKAWVTNLATGADLPKDDGPKPRTTPRPTATGRPQPGSTGPQGSQNPHAQGPPTTPRPASLHTKFDITALTQFFRLFGKHPTMNARLKRAYGQFRHGENSVELKSRLLWDTKLAERVLGHEIGHFIDLAVPLIGKGKQFAERVRPLFDFKNQIWKKQELRDEARNLSRDWRGTFLNGDRYRDSAEELFADFLSAMFNKPEWVNQKYPKLYDAFQDLRDAKPAFKSAYREIETWLQGDTVVREIAAQDKAAVEKTGDVLMRDDKKVRAGFRERMVFDMMSLWQRAFQKEGKPRLIGTSIAEKLEGSYLWAARQLALWHDDFAKAVQPHLDQVSSDPVEAHADLLSYSKAARTIGERRAAGVWIETHPLEARELLEGILDLDPTLKYKFANTLARAKDAELYDLSASIFREIHDRKQKYVDRIAKEIDAMKLGVNGQAALMAFNVRGKLLNPGGLTPETSAKMLDYLRDKLGPQKFAALEQAHAGLTGLLFNVQKEMVAAGLISKKTWQELIEPNQNNYLPYAVLDYFDGRVRAGVMPQRGTAHDVADVVASTQLKVASSYFWLQKQRQVQLIRDAYARGGSPLSVGEELDRANNLERIQAQHPKDDVSRAVMFVDGKPHLMEFPGDPGKLLQDAMNLPEFYNHIEWLHTASKFSHQVMQLFTQLSPRFLLYRNVIRGFRTAGLKVGFGAAFKQVTGENLKRNLALAKNYADSAFGTPMLPEVRRMIASEALPPPHVALGAVRDLPNMRELLYRGALPVFRAQQLRPDIAETRGQLSDKARRAKNVTDKIFTTYEAFEKIYNYQAAIAKGLPEETAAAIARRGGIPNPGVTGKWSSAAEILFPWTRVRIQGMRASYDLARDPRFRKGFLARFALTEAAPRLAKVAIAAGLIAKTISWVTGNKPDDKDDGVMAEVMKRISPYKMALDDVVPTMLYDPRTGKYHYFWEFKKGSDIPKHYEVVSLRIPASEEGQTWGTMLYNAAVSVPGANEKLAAPGQGVIENMGNWALNYVAPQPNPVLQTAGQLAAMVLQGRNPQDSFRGQPAANPALFNAGGTARAQAITGYTLNQFGGPGELAGVIAANAGLLDSRALDSLKSRLGTDKRTWDEKVPYLGAVVSHDNYAQYRDEQEAKILEDRTRARARLVMAPEVKSLYDFYYQNQAKAGAGKLTAAEQIQFNASKDFVQNIWGTLTKDKQPNPDSFFSKAAHAVGPDGSGQSKETVLRDLNSAAAYDLAVFKSARHH